MNKKCTLLLTALCGLSLIAGCGEKKELTVFKENMDSFYTQITDIQDSIQSIDIGSEDAASNLLSDLEQMVQQFDSLAAMEAPQEFSNIEELADDAATYMQQAYELYQQAYSQDFISDSYTQAASENYASAMKRISYIAALLQGEIPEGATVTEGDDTEFEPYNEYEEEDISYEETE